LLLHSLSVQLVSVRASRMCDAFWLRTRDRELHPLKRDFMRLQMIYVDWP
jgi:hypothetical protein